MSVNQNDFHNIGLFKKVVMKLNNNLGYVYCALSEKCGV